MRRFRMFAVVVLPLCSLAVGQTSFWPNSPMPAVTEAADDSASVTLGVVFSSDVAGTVTGVRFYKGAGNIGTHTGQLWSSAGTKLAEVTFTNESAAGWQQAQFTTPVSISANVNYTVSYTAPYGHYAYDLNYSWTSVASAPLRVSGASSGVFAYGSGPMFPTSTWNGSNYWVDVVFTPVTAPATPPPTTPPPTAERTFWAPSTTPTRPSGEADTAAITLGLKFSAEVSGQVTGVRFYKPTRNTGTHVGAIWSATGAVLAQATFTNESASGWQQVKFAAPVRISANTTYVVSYLAPRGYYAQDQSFAWSGLSASPLRVVGSSPGTFSYGTSLKYPANSWRNCNYWVDVMFVPDSSGPTPPPPPTTYTISGTINGTTATVTLSGASGAVTQAGSTGVYQFAGLSNGSYVVAPSQTGYTFTPSTAAVTVNGAAVSGVNFTATVIPPVSHSVTLSWSASSSPGVAGYNVYRATVAGGPYAKLNGSPVSSLSFTDASVAGGGTYFYVATAVDGSMVESGFSEEARAAVPF